MFPDGDCTINRLDRGSDAGGNETDEGLSGKMSESGGSLEWRRSCCRSISSDMRFNWRGVAGVEMSWAETLAGVSWLAGPGLDLRVDFTWPMIVADRLAVLGVSNCI